MRRFVTPVLVRPCGEGSQTGDGSTRENLKAGTPKRQNRSSGNSTDDEFFKTKAHLIKEIHHDSTWN